MLVLEAVANKALVVEATLSVVKLMKRVTLPM